MTTFSADGPNTDVVGIGNAIVDVIAHAADADLDRLGLTKGSMSLIDESDALELYAALESPIQTSGGSAANTMCGIASLGGAATFMGRVGDDDLGRLYAADLARAGVEFVVDIASGADPTGRSMILVTPDAERTMNTFLGAAAQFGPEDLSEAAITAAKVLYLEGYLYDRPTAKAAFDEAARMAHASGRLVAVTLSDLFCVERHRDDFLTLISDHVDIVFANEAELCGLYDTDSFDNATQAAADLCDLVVVTRSDKGSVVIRKDSSISIPPVAVASVVDTTGAGDLYAAGFLFGFTRSRDLAECGRLGSIAAAEVISHIGPRPEVALATLVAD